MGTPEQDPRVYLAAERTFLAWIRTGLALVGIGFTVSRFGLFLRELQATQAHLRLQSGGLSVVSGVALVGLGVLVLVAAVVQHLRLNRELAAGTWRPGRPSWLGVVLASLLALLGLGLAVYLLILR